ncbi:hypothetical protein MMC14_007325, partial [Varicellaria rhodocarpa]|nr:hypothetical protein [Varicellaria rhodocarpa]
MNDSSRCDSQGTVLVIVTSLFLALSTIVFALWLWARRIRRISLAFNDHALLGALVSKNSPYKDSAIQIADVFIGDLGQHIEDLTTNTIENTYK